MNNVFFGWLATGRGAMVLQEGEPWPHWSCSTAHFFPQSKGSVSSLRLVGVTLSPSLSITITMHATAAAQCQEGDCGAGLGQIGFTNTSHCLRSRAEGLSLSHKSIKRRIWLLMFTESVVCSSNSSPRTHTLSSPNRRKHYRLL